jgi:hypothetical protein
MNVIIQICNTASFLLESPLQQYCQINFTVKHVINSNTLDFRNNENVNVQSIKFLR